MKNAAQEFRQAEQRVQSTIKDLQPVRDIGQQLKAAGVKSAAHEYGAPTMAKAPAQQAQGRSL